VASEVEQEHYVEVVKHDDRMWMIAGVSLIVGLSRDQQRIWKIQSDGIDSSGRALAPLLGEMVSRLTSCRSKWKDESGRGRSELLLFKWRRGVAAAAGRLIMTVNRYAAFRRRTRTAKLSKSNDICIMIMNRCI
jgi:hypothetical protein